MVEDVKATKILSFFCRYIYCKTVFKDNEALRSHKTVEIKIFSQIFCLLLERSESGSEQIIKDPDPDLEGSNTFGIYVTRSRTLILMTRPYHSACFLPYIFWLTAVYYQSWALARDWGLRTE
jgi:hypothetical protein